MMNKQELENYIRENIRPATLQDEFKLERFSHSKLETFSQCRYRYYLHYEKEMQDENKSVALALGGLFHEIMEERGNAIIENKELKADAQQNWQDDIEKIRNTHWDEWTPDKNGLTYDEKIATFWKHYIKSIEDEVWKPTACEQEFHFVWKNKVRFYGFIDRIDIDKNGDYKVTDYKTSNSVYAQKDRDFSQQMTIYALACMSLYNKLPIEFEYDFVFLNQKADALKEPYSIEIALKNLEKKFKEIEEVKENLNYYPNGTPLCHWCPYCETNERSDESTKKMCKYYCLWTREKRNFSTNRPINKDGFNAEESYLEAQASNQNKGLVW